MFSPKRCQSETFSVRNVVIPNLNFVSPKRHQSESEKNTSSVRIKKKKNTPSVRIWNTPRQSELKNEKARRQSESKKHVVSPNLESKSSVRILKASRQSEKKTTLSVTMNLIHT